MWPGAEAEADEGIGEDVRGYGNRIRGAYTKKTDEEWVCHDQ